MPIEGMSISTIRPSRNVPLPPHTFPAKARPAGTRIFDTSRMSSGCSVAHATRGKNAAAIRVRMSIGQNNQLNNKSAYRQSGAAGRGMDCNPLLILRSKRGFVGRGCRFRGCCLAFLLFELLLKLRWACSIRSTSSL